MTLHRKWLSAAYDKDGKLIKKYWDAYMPLEKAVYKELLGSKTNHIEGSVSELAERFRMKTENVIGFLDGINEALDKPLDVKGLTEESIVQLDFSFEHLYKKMVEFRAEDLYGLPEWNDVFDEEARHQMYREQRGSTTIRKEAKTGRNDPCPCGSGKKYKNCCGARQDSA